MTGDGKKNKCVCEKNKYLLITLDCIYYVNGLQKRKNKIGFTIKTEWIIVSKVYT